MQSSEDKIVSPKVFKNVDEPIIYRNNVVMVQNLSGGSKIISYDIYSGKVKTLYNKGVFYSNFYSDGNNIVFEYTGSSKGIGLLNFEKFRVRELCKTGSGSVLGGIWKNYIALKQSNNIILYDIRKGQGKNISSSHRVVGKPVIGDEMCGYIELYKNKHCIKLYNIKYNKSLVYVPLVYVSNLDLVQNNLVYQGYRDGYYSINMYNINKGKENRCFETFDLVELYGCHKNTILWTSRKEYEGRYFFDLWSYNIKRNKLTKLLSNYEGLIIPTVSDDIVAWIDDGMCYDNLHVMRLGDIH